MRWFIIVGLILAPAVFLLVPWVQAKSKLKVYRDLGPELTSMKYQDVTFSNGSLQLAGMLFLPESRGPWPVAVFIHGSGTSVRDNTWYLSVAQRLQQSGVAVLLPDKRGSEKSQGDWTTASFADLAGDAAAAVDFVRHRPEFSSSPVGVIGFSQGGWIAPVVASQVRDLAFVVSMSGPGVTTDEQLDFEEVNNIARMGTYRFIARLLAPLAIRFIKREEFWKHNSGFDPLPYWRQVEAPTLMAFGENDRNLPVEESVRRIQALRKANITIKVYPDGRHGIITIDRQQLTFHVQERYLQDLLAFITVSCQG